MKNLKKVQFTNELTERAMAVYSNSSYEFYQDANGTYYWCHAGESNKNELGTLEDVEELLLDTQYSVRDREAGNEIERFTTLEEAKDALKAYEAQDKAEGTYEEDFYEIYDNALEEVVM